MNWLWLLAILVVLVCQSRGGRNRRDCSYEFNVWQPNANELARMANLETRFSNFTNYVDNELLRYQLQRAHDVADVRNWTLVYERSLNGLKDDQLQKYTKLQDVRIKLGMIEFSVEELKDKLDTSNHKPKRKKHIRKDRMLPVPVQQSDHAETPRHHELEFLRTLVADLKGQWILIKRDFIGMKNDNLGIRKEQRDIRNATRRCDARYGELDTKITRLQTSENGVTDDISSIKAQITQLNIDLATIKSGQLQLQANLVQQETGLTSLQASSVDMRRGLMDLQTSLGRLQTEKGDKGDTMTLTQTPAVDVNLPLTASSKDFIPKDCHDVMAMGHTTSGVYRIKVGPSRPPDTVYCDLDRNEAYTVIQRRVDGLQDFNRGWLEYKYGFGNVYGEFWAGNELIHALTQDSDYTLRVDILDWEGNQYFAEYEQFSVADEIERYALHVSGYHGNAGNSLSIHDGMFFSTKDRDSDIHDRNCAADNKGGWWFRGCYSSHLNGVYRVGWYAQAKYTFADGIVWFTLKNSDRYSLRKVEMKLKRRNI